MQTSQFKTFIVKIDDILFGHVVIGKYAEFIITREQKNFFRNCPCKCKNSISLDGKEQNDLYQSRCPGFTVRTDAIAESIRLGANILKVNFKPTNKDIKRMDTYIIRMSKFTNSATTNDNEGKLQYSCALHRFIPVE